MFVIDLINGALSFLTFYSKQTWQVDSGYYLLGSTILTSVVLALKFFITFYTQMSVDLSYQLFAFRSIKFYTFTKFILRLFYW